MDMEQIRRAYLPKHIDNINPELQREMIKLADQILELLEKYEVRDIFTLSVFPMYDSTRFGCFYADENGDHVYTLDYARWRDSEGELRWRGEID